MKCEIHTGYLWKLELSFSVWRRKAHEVMKINSCGSMNKYAITFCLCSYYRTLNIFVSRKMKINWGKHVALLSTDADRYNTFQRQFWICIHISFIPKAKKRKKSITIKETFTDFPQFAYINHRPFFTSAQVCVIPYVRFF